MNEPEFLKRECPSLLQTAKNVFGDLVVKAYVVSPNYTTFGEEFTQKELQNTMDAFHRVKCSLSSASDKFLLEFSNGNLILFVNSEWMIVEKVEPNEIPDA